MTKLSTKTTSARKTVQKVSPAKGKGKRIESIYREESNLDQALKLLTRARGATKEDLTEISWAAGLLTRLRRNYVVNSEGERGALTYYVSKQLA